MPINEDLYLQDKDIEQVASELSNLAAQCTKHGTSEESYATPGWAEYLDRQGLPLTLNDIPMQSCDTEDMHPIRRDLTKVPWEDSIKNFIFDVKSISTSSKFATCILLSEVDYKYQLATSNIIRAKYGKQNAASIDVLPCTTVVDGDKPGEVDVFLEFKLRVQQGDVLYESIVHSSTIISSLLQWYEPNSTIVFCHDSSIVEYQQVLTRMPESMWSVSCTYTNYITNKDKYKKCNYVCPNFNCPGSLETRVVSTGAINFTETSAPASYRGKLYYYFRCVRMSKHWTGKCYDCFTLLSAVFSTHQSPISTPMTSKFVKFTDKYLQSPVSSGVNSNDENDSAYGSVKEGGTPKLG